MIKPPERIRASSGTVVSYNTWIEHFHGYDPLCYFARWEPEEYIRIDLYNAIKDERDRLAAQIGE
jgi:hypothetical protein